MGLREDIKEVRDYYTAPECECCMCQPTKRVLEAASRWASVQMAQSIRKRYVETNPSGKTMNCVVKECPFHRDEPEWPCGCKVEMGCAYPLFDIDIWLSVYREQHEKSEALPEAD
jgi:hypothetical protein